MKSIFDASFSYRPSFDTNVRETIRRVRREQQAQIRWKEQVEIPQDQQASADSSDAAKQPDYGPAFSASA